VSTPRRLIVEYEDGSTKEASFKQVDAPTRANLARLGLCSAGESTPDSYLILQWADNTQEVLGVSGKAVDLLRYYVIRRIEEQGRLSVNTGADYPELFVINRMPTQLRSLLLVGKEGAKKYNLESVVEKWEGIFEEGGKKEFYKYDSTEPKYPHQVDNAFDIGETMNLVKKELDAKGTNAKKLLEIDPAKKAEEYNEIARAMGLRAFRSQGDIYNFLDFIIKSLAK